MLFAPRCPSPSRPWTSSLTITLLLGLLAQSPALAEPVRLSAPVFETVAEIEIRNLPREEAEVAIRAALGEIWALDQLILAEPTVAGGLAGIGTGGGEGLDPRLSGLLLGGLRYCFWSNGAHGPLGGAVYDLWAAAGANGTPHPIDLREAVADADCSRLGVKGDGNRPETLRFELGEGTRPLPIGSARGYAVDRAVAILEEHGATNAWVEIGPVVRALGSGPEGQGWLYALPRAPGEREPLDEVWLRDMAVAVVDDQPIYGDVVPWIDLRTGVPGRGVLMVAVAANAAFDAEVLAATLYVTGMREGLRRLGSLDPRPSVYWLLGQGAGQPLESTYRWSELPRLKRRR